MQEKPLNENQFQPRNLVNKVADEAGISSDQAQKAVESVKGYIVEKFPLLEGVVNNMFNAPGLQ